MNPKTIICAGGGGVGKTTTSAAMGLALARKGSRVLIVTIDPARRLADAMGVKLGDETQWIDLPGVEGRLAALMPDPASGSQRFMQYLFGPAPGSLERLNDNKLFKVLEDKLAGMAELIAMSLALQACREHAFDVIIVDTAPSRYALDFLSYPTRLAKMLEGRAMRWMTSMMDPRTRRGLINRWGRRKIESVLSAVLGESLFQDTLSLFTEMGLIRERFAALANELGDFLLGPNTIHVLVSAPLEPLAPTPPSCCGSSPISKRAPIPCSSIEPPWSHAIMRPWPKAIRPWLRRPRLCSKRRSSG